MSRRSTRPSPHRIARLLARDLVTAADQAGLDRLRITGLTYQEASIIAQGVRDANRQLQELRRNTRTEPVQRRAALVVKYTPDAQSDKPL